MKIYCRKCGTLMEFLRIDPSPLFCVGEIRVYKCPECGYEDRSEIPKRWVI